MIRKHGKMPNETTISTDYTKEYEETKPDCFTIQHGSVGADDRVVVVDDIIALTAKPCALLSIRGLIICAVESIGKGTRFWLRRSC